MRNLLFLLLGCMPLLNIAQHTAGKVTYGVQSDFKVEDIEGVSEEQMKRIRKRMEMASKQKMVLVFDSTESLFRNFDQEKDGKVEETYESEDGRMRMRFQMYRADNEMYVNTAKNELVEMNEFMGKKFLIKEDLVTIPWKLTGEMEIIMEYPCQKATWQKNDSTLIVAWFAPQIPVTTGPKGYGQLPGLILKMSFGKYGYIAREINFDPPKEGDIYIPDEGKKVTREKFNKIVKQKREEMREMYGKDNKRVIVTH